MLLATKHILTDKSSFPRKRCPGVAGRAGSPPGISEHRKQSPQTICKPFEAEDRGVTSCSRRGKATFRARAVQNPGGGAPGGCQSHRHHLASQDRSCSPAGRAGPSSWNGGSLAVRFCCKTWKCLQRYSPRAGSMGWKPILSAVSMKAHILLQHSGLKILCRVVLLLRPFRFVVSGMGYGIGFPGPHSWLPWGWRTQPGLQG